MSLGFPTVPVNYAIKGKILIEDFPFRELRKALPVLAEDVCGNRRLVWRSLHLRILAENNLLPAAIDSHDAAGLRIPRNPLTGKR